MPGALSGLERRRAASGDTKRTFSLSGRLSTFWYSVKTRVKAAGRWMRKHLLIVSAITLLLVGLVLWRRNRILTSSAGDVEGDAPPPRDSNDTTGTGDYWEAIDTRAEGS